jgi:hypothetical protein
LLKTGEIMRNSTKGVDAQTLLKAMREIANDVQERVLTDPETTMPQKMALRKFVRNLSTALESESDIVGDTDVAARRRRAARRQMAAPEAETPSAVVAAYEKGRRSAMRQMEVDTDIDEISPAQAALRKIRARRAAMRQMDDGNEIDESSAMAMRKNKLIQEAKSRIRARRQMQMEAEFDEEVLPPTASRRYRNF